MTLFTSADISSHNKSGDMWVAIHGSVYDISAFEEHPGGFEILLEHAGTDCSQIFDDIGHSGTAYEMLPQFKIGSFITEDRSNLKLPTRSPSLLANSNPTTPVTIVIGVACAIICLLLGFFIYYN